MKGLASRLGLGADAPDWAPASGDGDKDSGLGRWGRNRVGCRAQLIHSTLGHRSNVKYIQWARTDLRVSIGELHKQATGIKIVAHAHRRMTEFKRF